ncbi:MAG: alpha/beta hydrolase [Sphingomonas sp.]
MIHRILFALAATASTPAILGSAPVPAAMAPAVRTIQMDHISVQVIGDGSPVILIPGLSSPRAVWDGVAPGLAAHHRVYLVQINGFGGDDPRANLKPGVLAGVVDELHALIGQEKLAHAAVVGHSLGGLVGMMLAKAHPDDLARLMIVDSAPFIGVIFVPTATVAMLEPTAAGIRDQMIASYGKPSNAAAAESTANQLALKPDSRAKVAAWVKVSDPRVTGEALYEDMTTDLRPDMAGIATPITLVYPTSDKSDALYRALYAQAPHVTYVPVADSAHFVMLDQPAAFQAALDAFVAG